MKSEMKRKSKFKPLNLITRLECDFHKALITNIVAYLGNFYNNCLLGYQNCQFFPLNIIKIQFTTSKN